MDDAATTKKKLENLRKQYEAGQQRHAALTAEREALGAQLNAIQGAIQYATEALGEERNVVVQLDPPSRQQKRLAARKKK